jgi:hypothetical protein
LTPAETRPVLEETVSYCKHKQAIALTCSYYGRCGKLERTEQHGLKYKVLTDDLANALFSIHITKGSKPVFIHRE